MKIALHENSSCKFKRWDARRGTILAFQWKLRTYANLVGYVKFSIQENFGIDHSWISQAYCAWKNKGKDLGKGGNVFTENSH